MKRSSDEDLPFWKTLLGRHRNILLLLLGVAGLGYAAREAWAYWGASHAHWESYSVAWSDVEVTPQPGWVRCDVRGEVTRREESPRLPLRDHEVTRQVAQSFALHPWVEQVVRVTKSFPAKITVELVYRRPVAMVEVEFEGQAGLLPVDRFGTLLPPRDFTPGDAKSLPRIRIERAFPAGSVGSAWGDERVAGASRIAEQLLEQWNATPLHCISALPPAPGSTPEQTRYELLTRGQRHFIWGRAPGREESGEPAVDAKRLRLIDTLRSAGEATVDLAKS